MRAIVFVRCLILATTLGAAACGGGSSSPAPAPSPSPTPTPTPSPSPGSPGLVMIVGERAANSFNPNPSAPDNGSMRWDNADGVTHRIVANDNSFDTGNIAPGETSAAMAVSANGVHYHCSIHPSMIGAVNSSGGNTPPCTGQYC
jgi:plastocyanin